MAQSKNNSNAVGPLLYENWKHFESGGSLGPLLEYQLFSDAVLYGQFRSPHSPTRKPYPTTTSFP